MAYGGADAGGGEDEGGDGGGSVGGDYVEGEVAVVLIKAVGMMMGP